MYKFKTEEEFLETYGENWRGIVDGSWPTAMDYLFGKDIEKAYSDYISVKGYCRYGKWYVSKGMVKIDSALKPSIIKRKKVTINVKI